MYNFDAPIPGQSLTMPPGAMAMEHPPSFTDPEQALEYIWNKLTVPKKARDLILLLKKGAPVEYIVNTVLFEGVIQGLWTVDVAMLMYQVVVWQVEKIAQMKGVKYKFRNDDPREEEFLSQFVDLLDVESSAPMPSTSKSPFKGLL